MRRDRRGDSDVVTRREGGKMGKELAGIGSDRDRRVHFRCMSLRLRAIRANYTVIPPQAETVFDQCR